MPVRGALFNKDGTCILTWAYGTSWHSGEIIYLHIWDSTNGKELVSPLKHESMIHNAAFNSDGSRILTLNDDGTTRIWDRNTGKELLQPLKKSSRGAVLNHEGNRILTWGYEGAAHLRDSNTGKELFPSFKHRESVVEAMFNHTEDRILTWSED